MENKIKKLLMAVIALFISTTAMAQTPNDFSERCFTYGMTAKTNPVWKVLVLAYKNADVTYVDKNGVTQHHTASMTDAQKRGIFESARKTESLVSELSNQEVIAQFDVVYIDRPITTVTERVDKGYYWTSPADTKPELDLYGPEGKYDSVIIQWVSVPANAGGLAYSYGTVDSANGMTYAWTMLMPDASEYWLHEWLHGVEGFYKNLGYNANGSQPDWGGGAGYTDDLYDGYQHFYYDLMTGKVPGDVSGIPAAGWRQRSVHTTRKYYVADYFSDDTTARYETKGDVQWLFDPVQRKKEQKIALGDGSVGDHKMLLPVENLENFELSGRVYIPTSGVSNYDSISLAVSDGLSEYWVGLYYGTSLIERNNIVVAVNDSVKTQSPKNLVSGWYQIKAEIDTDNDTIKAKVWHEYDNEPANWELTYNLPASWKASKIGFRHYGPGIYVDSLTAIALEESPEPVYIGGNTGLRGEYFGSIDFTTAPVFVRNDSVIDFNWGADSPASEVISPDDFSIRWSGMIQAEKDELYTFYTNSDDGVRLWINNQLVIDKWQNQGLTEWSGTIELLAGTLYPVVLEYYDIKYDAAVSLSWSSATTPKEIIPTEQLWPAEASAENMGTGLTAKYYNGTNFLDLKVTRVDNNINFNWDQGSPDPAVNADNFTARWTGEIMPLYDGNHTFTTTTDDGVRLWINNQLLVDKWVNQAPTAHSGTIELKAGKKYSITMEYYEAHYGAMATLKWQAPGQISSIVPQYVLYPEGSTPNDTEDPTTPTGLNGISAGPDYINIAWNTSTDNVGVVSYEVRYYHEGGPVGTQTVQGTTASLTGLEAGKEYSISVQAKDAAGNASTWSTITVSTQGSSYPAWQTGTAYQTGEIVSHNGSNWRAKWWTQNEEPGTTGEWGVWEKL